MTRKHETRGAALAAMLLSLSLLCGPAPRRAQAVAPSPSSSPPLVAPASSGRVAPTQSGVAQASPGKEAAAVRAQKSLGQQKSFGQLPASFEVNAGQADARFKFLWRGGRHTLLLGADGATLALRAGGEGGGRAGAASQRRASGETVSDARGAAPPLQLLSMKFVGANPRAAVGGERELKGKANYFIGNDPAKWRTNVPTYAQVRYRNLYRGIDLVYHGGRGGLEYDFVLAPGADASAIRVRFEGAESLSVEPGGGLLVHTKAGPLRQSRPVLYQEVAGARREVEGGYVLRGRNEIGFRVGAYDRAAPLVIDPVIVYSTYFLGAYRMAVDPAGNVYAVGTSDFVPVRPTPGAFQKRLRGASDAFVAKLDAAGRELVYVTYLGGGAPNLDGFAGSEFGMDIAADAAGSAYVTGITYSADFPVANAFQPAHGGGFGDGFVAKLNADGSALVYSSFIGGGEGDSCRSIAVDAAGAAYLLGGTDSTDFPVRNAFQPARKGSNDYFVAKVAPAGSSLDYSTYLGGTDSEHDFAGAIAVDAAGSAYVAGSSTSADYPVTPNAFQPAIKSPGSFLSDAVVTKLAPSGTALVYSTYFGGTISEFVADVAVDSAGQAHFVGYTGSSDFPTQNPLDPAGLNPGGFLTKLNAAGTGLVYSTRLSGTPPPCRTSLHSITICGNDEATGVATDAAGNAYVAGVTVSKDFPAPVNALQPRLSGGADAYLIKLDPAGRALFSTYLGGAAYEYGSDLHAAPDGTAYVLGATDSHDFPLVNPYRDNFARELDPALNGFLVKISTADPPDAAASRVSFTSAAFAVDEAGGSALVSVTRAGDLSRAVTVDYATGDQTASERSDYTTARGRLHFAPGETTKTFTVFVADDRTVEGDETLSLTLHDLRGDGAVLAAPVSAALTLRDDDDRPTGVNPIDDSRFFVRQHYLDFLGREPDAAGLDFWTNEIEQCGADQQCRGMKRVNVSAAFFLSIEFQETGFLVERLSRLAFRRHASYETFVRDARRIGEGVVVGQGDWQQRLDANRRAYAAEFVARSAFVERYPEDMLPWDYVDRLNANSGGSLSRAERDALVVALEFGLETRAGVLLRIADDADFRRREFNPAFVLMQYLGYLRRDPEDPPDFSNDGYNFWLLKLDEFRGDWRAAEMVRAFIESIEYRGRFNEPLKEAALGVPFTLEFGETAVVLPDKLRVRLLDIGFDTRCPRLAPCPSPGGITILLGATRPGGDTARFMLRIEGGVPRPHTDNPPVSALGYRFRLLQVDPAPPFTAQFEPYRVLLQVEKE